MKKLSLFKRPTQKSRIIFALQMLFLIFSLFLILWAQMKLRDMAKNSKAPAERKAKVIFEDQ